MSADKQPTKFAIDNNGDHIYFGKNGLEWHLSKIVPMEADELNETTHSKLNEEEREEEREEEENENRKIIEKIVSMQWLNTNPNCVIECEGKSNHYFTYGEAKYSSYGYKKIVYKNLYPNIDIEYIIPKSGGIKYSLIIHEGADINDVKYRYSGDDVSVSIEGNQLHIKNLICDLVEHEPVVNYENGVRIKCQYKLSKNEIGFEFLEAIDNTKKIIIDPWVAPITTLTATGLGNNRGYDVDYDYQGNLFVYGGGNYAPFWFITSENTRVAKYSPSGVLLWTFNGSVATPFWQSKGSSGYMSNFVVDKVYGKTYVGQVLIPSGCAIIRLDTNGAYDNFISTPNPNFVEIWEMNFDCRAGNILGMGGSISSNKQIGIVNSTGSFSPQNITGNISAYQDILSSTVTNSGNFCCYRNWRKCCIK